MTTCSSPPGSSPQPFKVRASDYTTATLVAPQLILGSSSVARKHILEEMGLEFQVMVGRAATALVLPVN
jgi:septum formation protein